MDPHWSSKQVAFTNFTSTSSSGSQQPMQALNETTDYRLEALSEPWQIFLASLYSLTAITSFVLNVITVIVLARYRHSELRKYLINLSVSDLLMSCLSIPFTYTEYMLGRWIFAPFLCPLVRFVVTLSVFVSVATMTVIGINRHLAVMYPLRKRTCLKCICFHRNQSVMMRKSHVIVAIWLIGFAISAPEYLMHRVEQFPYNGQLYAQCTAQWESESISDLYTVFIFSCTFALPLAVLSFLYARIGLKLWRRQMPGNVDINRDLTMQTTRIKVIKMLFVVVILFAISWLPMQTFAMVVFLFPGTRKNFVYESAQYNIFVGSYFVCHWLSMFHSCLNPLIYCFMNEKFRTDLHDLLCNRAKSYNNNKSSHFSNHYQGSAMPHYYAAKWFPSFNSSSANSTTVVVAGSSTTRRAQSVRAAEPSSCPAASTRRGRLSSAAVVNHDDEQLTASSRRCRSTNNHHQTVKLLGVHSSAHLCGALTSTNTITTITASSPPSGSASPREEGDQHQTRAMMATVVGGGGGSGVARYQRDGATDMEASHSAGDDDGKSGIREDTSTSKSDQAQISLDFVRIVSLPASDQGNNDRHGLSANAAGNNNNSTNGEQQHNFSLAADGRPPALLLTTQSGSSVGSPDSILLVEQYQEKADLKGGKEDEQKEKEPQQLG